MKNPPKNERGKGGDRRGGSGQDTGGSRKGGGDRRKKDTGRQNRKQIPKQIKYDEQEEIRKAYSGQQHLDPNNPYSSMYQYGPNGEFPIPTTTPQQRQLVFMGAVVLLAVLIAPEVVLPLVASGAWKPALEFAR